MKTPSEDITPTPEHILELIRNAPSTHDWRLIWRGGNSFEIRAPHENGRENWWTAIADLHTSRENAETIFAQIIWAQAHRPSMNRTMIKGEAYVSVPAEGTTDIAAETETFGFIGPQPDCFRCGSAYRTKMTEHMGASRATEAWLRHVERDHGPERDAAVSDVGQ